MKKINFAIIGFGRIGKRHAGHIQKIGNLVAVCDNDDSKKSEVKELDNVQFYSNILDLFKYQKNIDVVAICTPNGLHAEHSIISLNNSCHVLCEKPFALNLIDCGNMMKAAENNNKRLFVVKQNRFNPPIVKLKELIDNGNLGKIFSVQLNCFWNRNFDYYKNSWKGTLELDGGTLFTQFSHFIDLLYYLIGDVSEVCGFSDNFNHKEVIEFEDSGVAAIKFHNGVIGTINYTVNSFGKNFEGSITIFSEYGTIKVGGQYLNELEYQNVKGIEIKDLPKGNLPNNYGNYVGSMSNHGLVYENLVDVINDKSSISASAMDGLKTVEIIEKLYNAIRK